MTHIVSEWLSLATHLERTSLPLLPILIPEKPIDPELIVIEHLAAMIKLKFDSKVADDIIPTLVGMICMYIYIHIDICIFTYSIYINMFKYVHIYEYFYISICVYIYISYLHL
jgi:hypothetical protein